MPPFQLCANCRHKASNWCSSCDSRLALGVTPLDFTAAPQEWLMSVQGQRDIAGLGYNAHSFATPLNVTVPEAPQHPQANRSQHWPAYATATAPAAPAQFGHSSFQSSQNLNATSSWVAPVPQMPTLSQPLVFHAIYFCKDEEAPRIVQVRCMPLADRNSVTMCPVPLVLPYLPTSGGYPPINIVLAQTPRAQLRNPLQIWFCSGGSNAPNRAILRLTSGRVAWKGDVVVMKFSGSRLDGYSNVSSTMNELTDLAHFFTSQK